MLPTAIRLQRITTILSKPLIPICFSTSPLSFSAPVQSKFQILAKKAINHDCYIYHLGWAGPKFQMKIGQHFRIVEQIDGEEVIRKYTPISRCSQKDLIQLLVKIYRPNTNPNYPKGGKLTPYLQTLQVGDLINIDGPFGKFQYQGAGKFILEKKLFHKRRVFFIAGGTGITPCYQVIREIVEMGTREQEIEFILLFANRKQEDIILRRELEQLQPRLKLNYILEHVPEKWEHFSGYPTKDMLEKICQLDDPETLYIYCGPRLMNNAIKDIFNKHYPQSTIFKF